jgi:hypothetical protein
MAKKIAEYEKKRISLIRKVNRYLNDDTIRHHLGKMAGPPLAPNTSYEQAEYVYNIITSTLTLSRYATRYLVAYRLNVDNSVLTMTHLFEK